MTQDRKILLIGGAIALGQTLTSVAEAASPAAVKVNVILAITVQQ